MSALSRIRLKELDDLRAENERLRTALQVDPDEPPAGYEPCPECGNSWVARRRTQSDLRAANRRIEALERDLSIEIDAGHDTVERAEAAERELNELRAKWEPLVTWAAAKEKAELAGKGEL